MTESTKLKYIDNGDETVSDTRHGVMWMKNDTWLELGRLITWHDSLELARKKNEEKFAGYSNWRIPSASEAKYLFDPESSNTDVEGCEIHIDPVFPPGCGFSTWTHGRGGHQNHHESGGDFAVGLLFTGRLPHGARDGLWFGGDLDRARHLALPKGLRVWRYLASEELDGHSSLSLAWRFSGK